MSPTRYDPDPYGTAGVLIAGKTMRARKEVLYDDGLTDKQFAKQLEKAAVTEEQKVVKEKEKVCEKEEDSYL